MNYNARIEALMERFWKKDGAPAWTNVQPPVFNMRPNSEEEETTNLKKYLTGYPWIVVTTDKGDYPSYFCCLCKKMATPLHLRQEDHNRRACRDYNGRVPEWMSRFRANATTWNHGALWSYWTKIVYPDDEEIPTPARPNPAAEEVGPVAEEVAPKGPSIGTARIENRNNDDYDRSTNKRMRTAPASSSTRDDRGNTPGALSIPGRPW